MILISAARTWGAGCTVSTVPVRFGQYNFLDHTPVDAIGNVKIGCFPGTPFTIKLGSGENAVAGFHPRRMRCAMGGKTLSYNLYRDTVRTVVWGDGTSNTSVQSGIVMGGDKVFNVYGRLPGMQNAEPGVYRDSIAVTVEW